MDRQLSDPSQQARQSAMIEISRALTQEENSTATIPQLVDQIRTNICAQLATLLRQTDPEVQARVTTLLAFREGLSNFSAAALQVPAPQRQALLDWGFSSGKDGGVQIVGLAFAGNSQDRIQAAQLLGDADGPAADWVLAQLIRDEDREVSLNAMDAAWDRDPAPEIINALWDKSVIFAFEQNGYREESQARKSFGPQNNGPQNNVPRVIKVGDRNVQVFDNDLRLGCCVADNDVATDLLIDFQSPLVQEKIESLFQQVIDMKFTSANNSAAQFRLYLISPNYPPVGSNMQRLMEAYKPRNVVNLLADMILSPARDGWDNQFNNQALRFSTRIDAMGLLCRLVDLDKDEFKLVKRQEYGNRWGLAGKAEEEEAAVKKIKTWWQEHKSEFEKSSATAPAK